MHADVTLQLHLVPIDKPTDLNVILGQAHFIKTVEDLHVKDIAQLMAAHGIHCVVVAGIDRRERGGDRLAWGIVSDLDLIRALAPGTPAASAGRLAATEIVTVEPTDSLEHRAAHGRPRHPPSRCRLLGLGPPRQRAVHARHRAGHRRLAAVDQVKNNGLVVRWTTDACSSDQPQGCTDAGSALRMRGLSGEVVRAGHPAARPRAGRLRRVRRTPDPPRAGRRAPSRSA